MPLIVDNTLATPYLCRPIEHGADIVVHSTTKFLVRPRQCARRRGGRIAASSTGRRAADFPSLTEPEPAYHGLKFFENFGDFAFTMKARAVALRDFGPALAPMNAFLTITGVETLHVRMERHVANARKVAEFLDGASEGRLGLLRRPAVEPVFRAARRRYLPKGAGAVFTFGVEGGYRGGDQAGRERPAVLASRQRRRHAQPDPAPGLDHPPPADRGAARRRRRRRRRHPPVGRARDGRGSDPRPRSGAGGVTPQGLTGQGRRLAAPIAALARRGLRR